MLKAFAVFDVKAASFGSPMFISNSGLALRGFSDACADPASAMAKHPADYTLFEIGTYDPNNGVLVALEHHLIVASAASVLALLMPEVEQPSLPLVKSEAGS